MGANKELSLYASGTGGTSKFHEMTGRSYMMIGDKKVTGDFIFNNIREALSYAVQHIAKHDPQPPHVQAFNDDEVAMPGDPITKYIVTHESGVTIMVEHFES